MSSSSSEDTSLTGLRLCLYNQHNYTPKALCPNIVMLGIKPQPRSFDRRGLIRVRTPCHCTALSFEGPDVSFSLSGGKNELQTQKAQVPGAEVRSPLRFPLRSPCFLPPILRDRGEGGTLTLSPPLRSSASAMDWLPLCPRGGFLFSVPCTCCSLPQGCVLGSRWGFWSRPCSSVSRCSLSLRLGSYAVLVMYSSDFQPWSRSSATLQVGGWVWAACASDRGGCRPCHLLSPAVTCLALFSRALSTPAS